MQLIVSPGGRMFTCYLAQATLRRILCYVLLPVGQGYRRQGLGFGPCRSLALQGGISVPGPMGQKPRPVGRRWFCSARASPGFRPAAVLFVSD